MVLTYSDLLPVFVGAIMINFTLLGFYVYCFYRLIRIRKMEFYRFTVILWSCAGFISRIGFYTIFEFEYPHLEFNTFNGYHNVDQDERYMMGVPHVGISMIGVTYGFRWIEQYAHALKVLSSSVQISSRSYSIYVVCYVVFTILILAGMLIMLSYKEICDYYRIIVISMYFGTFLLLTITTDLFLSKLK